MKTGVSAVLCVAVLGLCLCSFPMHASAQATLEKQAVEAMKKAAQFYYGKVSTKGGYLFEYTVDMKYRYGEMPARESQIWVQDPATPGVGQIYLDAYEATGDMFYLEAADAAARALIRGQLDCGGWNYLIDFKAGSIDDWYKHEGNHPDFNEFSHFDGNATFDDAVTSGPTMLLLRLYDITSDPVYLGPLEKALNFVLEAQLPLGGWSQRYPFIGTGYDTYYTFNDDVIQNNIDLLLNAYKILANKKYLEAAMHGADFIIVSQHAGPQYGWGLQYTHDLKLAWGRILEPPSLTPSATTANVNMLMDTYEITGDRRYLEPIPKALDWLDSAIMPDGSIGTFIEEGTNKPLAAMYEGDSGSYDSIKITYDLSKAMGGYGFVSKNFSTKRERERYGKLASAVWEKPPDAPSLPTGEQALKQAQAMEGNIRKIIDALDEQGRWTEDGRMYSARFCYKNDYEFTGPVMKNGWIRTRTFIRNMRTLSRYVNLTKNATASR
ncbi:pectate lyase [bacterium]|nr:pectate lyase [bacterium]